MLTAVVLDERARGTSHDDIERRWRVSGVGEGEESWRDTALWLLAGHAAMCSIRCFYHHIREECSVTDEQIVEIKRALATMRSQAFTLLGELKHCSPLGTVLLGIRNSRPGHKGPSVGAHHPQA